MGLTLLAYANGPEGISPQLRTALKAMTPRQRRAARPQPVAGNAGTEEGLSRFLGRRRLDHSANGLPEISRWDPIGRPEFYRPQDLDQVVLDLQEAELLTAEEAERAAVRDALTLVRRCQREGLYLSVLPD